MNDNELSGVAIAGMALCALAMLAPPILFAILRAFAWPVTATLRAFDRFEEWYEARQVEKIPKATARIRK